MTHDLRKYKEAKAILPQLDEILKIFNLAERALVNYSSYIPVAETLFMLRKQKFILETYQKEYKKIKETKAAKKTTT